MRVRRSGDWRSERPIFYVKCDAQYRWMQPSTRVNPDKIIEIEVRGHRHKSHREYSVRNVAKISSSRSAQRGHDACGCTGQIRVDLTVNDQQARVTRRGGKREERGASEK